MKAMIFAAGLGTRLQPLTLTTPKALVEVAGRPAISYAIDHLLAVGVDEFVVNLHHFPQQIKRYISTAYPRLKVSYSDESELLLDTGGALRKAAHLLADDAPVIVHNADIVTSAPIKEMMAQHIATGADATLLVSDRHSSRRLLFDAEGAMRGWENTTTGEVRPASLADTRELRPMAFGGVHIVSQDIIRRLAEYPQEKFSITPFYIDTCRQLDIRAYEPEQPYYWFDIGSVEKLSKATDYLNTINTSNI